MRSAYADVPQWLGLLIGAMIIALSVGGIVLERRTEGGFRRSRLVWGTAGVVVGALFVLDALV